MGWQESSILTWFRNTCANVIKLDFRRFDTAIEVWDFLVSRYSISNDIHQFQLYRRLHRMQQKSGQTMHSYISKLQVLWDQLASCNPTWPNTEAAKVYADLRDRQCIWHLLMTVRDEFESVQSSPLHCISLPKLDTMIKDLISE